MSIAQYIRRVPAVRSIVAGTILTLCLAVIGAHAQQGGTATGWQFGAHVAGDLALPSADFKQFPGVVSCLDSSSFTSGSGGGFFAGLEFGYRPPMLNDPMTHIGYGARVGYASMKTTFTTTERIGSGVDAVGNVSDIIDAYDVAATVGTIRVEPTVRYIISSDLPLSFDVAVPLGITMSVGYSQVERIDSPSGATYVDGTTERDVSQGDVTGSDRSGLVAGLAIGAAYEIGLAETFMLRPEVSWQFGLNSPVSGVTWSPNGLRFGISALFLPSPVYSTPLAPGESR